jgi:transposase
MSKTKILMEKIREILKLSIGQKMSLRAVSSATGVCKTSVGEYLREFKRSGLPYEKLPKLNDDKLASLFENSKCASNKKYKELSVEFAGYEKELKRPGVSLYLLWEEYKNKHPEGLSYARFCHHYKMWKGKHKPEMHMIYKAGEKMFVDFAGKKQSIVDIETGEIIEVEVFVAILASSQKTYVEACYDQKKETWIRLQVNAFEYFGGVTRAIVPDNLKSGITKACKYEPVVNETYQDFADHYNTVILPARPGKPKDKSFVESAVNIIYHRIYAPLRDMTFFSLDELNVSMWQELEKHNNTPFQKRDSTRNILFEEIEREELISLPPTRYELKEFLKLRVEFNYHIFFKEDKHSYSVPYKYAGLKVKVVYTHSVVEIYDNNERIAFHKRNRKAYEYTTVPEHMPPNHQFIAGWDTSRFLRWSQKIGETAYEFIQKLLDSKAHPEQAFKACMGVLRLEKKYGKEAFESVCKNAIEFNCISYRFIDNSLKNKTYLLSSDKEESAELPEHENIRGKANYQ